jgi:biopolymer transport protein ExbD
MVFGHNEQNLDDLISHLVSLKAAADSSASDLIVNIMPNDEAVHGRIIKVMDACAAANVKNMSFSMTM